MAVKYRSTIVDGIFYPESKSELSEMLASFCADGERDSARVIVAPHAGYSYSGGIAAKAFLAAGSRQLKRAVVIGPLHREQEDAIFLPESDAFKTPLGVLPVDGELLAELSSCSNRFVVNDIPHLEEHSIEVLLPFLQYLYAELPIIPVLVGKTTQANIRALSGALEVVFSHTWDDTLLILSSNLCGFISREEAASQSELFLDLIAKKNWQGILEARREKKISACGDGCVASALGTPSISGLDISLIDRGDSAALQSEDTENRVHYAALSMK